MCSQYTLKTKGLELKRIGYFDESDDLEINDRYLPYRFAPIVVRRDGKSVVEKMNFSLVPNWSKEPKVKFATHNARIETILEKPTWKNPFKKNHCLVPISTFYEPSYEGPLAGNILGFSDSEEKLLLAAGIYDSWLNKETGQVLESFSILTTEPTPQIINHGHDRSPIFLNHDNAMVWLEMDENPNEQREFLLAAHQVNIFKIVVDRPMKSGWDQRK